MASERFLATLEQPELDVPRDQRLERPSRELLLEPRRDRLTRERVQLARVTGRDQHAQVLAPRVLRHLTWRKDLHHALLSRMFPKSASRRSSSSSRPAARETR